MERLGSPGLEVLFSDVNEEANAHFRDEVGQRFISTDDVCDTACDVLAPCAVGGTINVETIPRLRCKAIVGSANNQLGLAEDATRLMERGIL